VTPTLDLEWLDAWWADWLVTSPDQLRRGGTVVADHLDTSA
jgi:hypothetical protein